MPVPAAQGGGRCEACEGAGVKEVEMHFLANVFVTCEVCRGRRYNDATLRVRFKERSIADILETPVDEALELFVQMAKVDDETLETHFALGHLFRRRGEVERAIRVHENLLARPNLSETQRHQAAFSLAEDYLGAGLYDRAEDKLIELVESPTLAESALEKAVGS